MRQGNPVCDEFRDDLEAYAAGALDADARGRIDGHLSGCPDCSAIVGEYDDLFDRLAHTIAAADPSAPPPELRERVLRAVAKAASTAPRARTETKRPSEHVSSIGRFGRWFLQPRRVALAGGVLLLLASFTWGARLQSTLAAERQNRAMLAALVGQQEVVLEVVDSNQTVKRLLRAATPGSTSYGKVYVRPDLPYLVAMTGRLPAATEDRSYLLWLSKGRQWSLAGPLTVNEQGFGLLVLNTGENGPSFDAALVTLQQAGAEAPSDNVILSWKMDGR